MILQNTLAAPFVVTSAEREATTEPATSAARPPSEQQKLFRSSVGKILSLHIVPSGELA